MPNNTCKEEHFRQVFEAQAEKLRNFLFYRTGNLAQAEDHMQEAFIRLWQNCAKVTMEKAPAYLFTVANNLFLNEVEHRKVVLKFENNTKSVQDNQTPQYLMEEEEFKQRLKTAIGELPEKQRVVFLMNRIDKKTYTTIAEELEISVKAVEKRMHKALEALRKVHKKV